ncbi:MAG: hypothetical protein C0418_03855 [Coriobacteriaceae bacterium]|nr:hypothetical protein [Coriobacteriaceae bacterium]
MTAAGVSYAEAREALAEVLVPGSVEHCERVAQESARLARAYGLDEERARLAGLLHDWCRDADDPDLLAAAARLKVPITETDRRRPYLLHARVAAAELEERFPGLDADVLEAIGAHTLGEMGMGPLAEAVYVADMIEPARAWHGVEELRSAVGVSTLGELFARALARTLGHVIARGRPIHPTALAVWNSIAGR